MMTLRFFRACAGIVLGGLLSLSPLIAAEVPFLAGRVNDTAEILSVTARSELEALLKAHEDSTSNQVVILTIRSLEGDVLEEYSMKVVETWKPGQRDKDNGVLLLVAKEDRKVRIEVGQGLEGSLTDLVAGSIIRKEIVPRFRDGDYEGGIRGGVNAILAAIRGEYVADETTSDGGGIEEFWAKVMAFSIFLIVVGVFTTIAVLSDGFVSWFLYVFLIPFWGLFPTAILGFLPGIIMFGTYAVGFIIAKTWFARSDVGKKLKIKWAPRAGSGFGSAGSSWSSSSSGSSFSGGGGGFSGGGSSGSW
jgi:uncharacterized protein